VAGHPSECTTHKCTHTHTYANATHFIRSTVFFVLLWYYTNSHFIYSFAKKFHDSERYSLSARCESRLTAPRTHFGCREDRRFESAIKNGEDDDVAIVK